MFHPLNPGKRFARVALLSLLTIPLMAHKVEVSGDVGGTSHIEPNDDPRAGEPSLVWFALTKRGGTVIPLNTCNCQLAVYAEPRTANATPLQEPPLKAVAAEGYTGIPGAEVTFPNVGAYELVIKGTPIAAEDFQPFELTFPVTVVAGQSSPSPTPATPSPAVSLSPSISGADPQPTSQPVGDRSSFPLGWLLIPGGIAIAAILWGLGRRSSAN
jgi:hypothetical protein